jgi:hypothetical protein
MFAKLFQIQKSLTHGLNLTLILCIAFFLVLSNISGQALTSADVNATTPQACKEAIAPKEVKIWDMLPPRGPNIANYLPIIPQSCAVTANGEAIQPLGIKVIPDIVIRLIGLLFTLAFTILPLAVILLGFNLALKPFDPSINKTQFTEITTLPRLITKQLGGFVIGLALILFSYTIVFTVLNLLGFQGEYTKLDRFFTP